MKIFVNLDDVKLVHTFQGLYLKAGVDFKYMIVLLPESVKLNQVGKDLTIEIDDYFYKRKRLYRFDKKHIDKFKIEKGLKSE
jgi:hypothetical protein